MAIQRKLTFKSPRLTALKKDKKEGKQRIGDAIFGTLCAALERYETVDDSISGKQLVLLQQLEALAREWLAIHGDSEKESRRRRVRRSKSC